MSSTLKILDESAYLNEELTEITISEGVDIGELKRIKEVSQRFLQVNDFDLGDEPIIKDLSKDEFIEYIETKNNHSIIATKLNELSFNITFRSLMSNYYTHREDKDKKIFIFFLPDDSRTNSIGKTDFKKFITLVFTLDCREGVMISSKDLSPKSKEQLRNCNINPVECDDVYNIISYKDSDFIDITGHAFVPEVMKIYRCGKEETDLFIKENKFNPTKLPRMLDTDPLNKFYRGQVGDIFQLKRKNLVNGNILEEQIAFRVVVPGIIKKGK